MTADATMQEASHGQTGVGVLRPQSLSSIGSMSRGLVAAATRGASAGQIAWQQPTVAQDAPQPAPSNTRTSEPDNSPPRDHSLADSTHKPSLTPDTSFSLPPRAASPPTARHASYTAALPPKLPLTNATLSKTGPRSSGGIPTGHSTARSSGGPGSTGVSTRKSMTIGDLQTRKSLAPKVSKLPVSGSWREKDAGDQLTSRSSRLNTARSHMTQASSVLKLEALEDEMPGEARRGSDGSRLSLFQVLDMGDDDDHGVFLSRAANSYDIAVNKPWRNTAIGQKGSVESHQKRMKEREEVHRTLTTWVQDVLQNRVQSLPEADAEHVDAEQLDLDERLMDKTMRADPTGVGYQLRAHWNQTVQEEVELRFNKMRDKWESELAGEMEELAELRVKVKELSTGHRELKDKLLSLQMKYDLTIRQARTPPPPPPAPAPVLAPQQSQAPPTQQASEQQPQTAESATTSEPQPTAADLAQFAEEILKLKDALATAKQEKAQAVKQTADAVKAMDLTVKAKEETQSQLDRAKTEGAVLGLKLEETRSELSSVQQELDVLKRQAARQAAVGSRGGDGGGSGNNSPSRAGGKASAQSHPARPAKPGAGGAAKKPPASSGGGGAATASSKATAAPADTALGEADATEIAETKEQEMAAGASEAPADPPAGTTISVVARTSTAGGASNNAAAQAALSAAKTEAVTYKREMERLSLHVTELHNQLDGKTSEVDKLTEKLKELREAQKEAAALSSTSVAQETQKDPLALARAAKAEAEVLMSRKRIQKLEADLSKVQKELAAAKVPAMSTHHFEVAVEVERTRRMQLVTSLQDGILSGLQTLYQRLVDADPGQDSALNAQALTNQLVIMLQDLLQESSLGLDNLLQPAPTIVGRGSLSGTPNRMVNLKPSDLQGLLANSNAKLQQLFGMGGGRPSLTGTPAAAALDAATTGPDPNATTGRVVDGDVKLRSSFKHSPQSTQQAQDSAAPRSRLSHQLSIAQATAADVVFAAAEQNVGLEQAAAIQQPLQGDADAGRRALGSDVSFCNFQPHQGLDASAAESPGLASSAQADGMNADQSQDLQPAESHPPWTAFGCNPKSKAATHSRTVRVHTVEAGASPVKPLRPLSALPVHLAQQEPTQPAGLASSGSSTALQRPFSAAASPDRTHNREGRFIRQHASYVSTDAPLLSVGSMTVRPRPSTATCDSTRQPVTQPATQAATQGSQAPGIDVGQSEATLPSSPTRVWGLQQLQDAEQRAREQMSKAGAVIPGGLQWKPIPVGSTSSAGRPRTGGASPTRTRPGNVSPERDAHQSTADQQLPPLVLYQQVGGLPPHLKHNVYQNQPDQPAGAFKVRLITATPQKGIHHPRHESASCSGATDRYNAGWGLNLEPGQGPPQLAASPSPVMLSSLVGNSMGLSAASHTWALQPHGVPAGALLHVPGNEKPVVSPYELMTRSELVAAVKALQADMEEQAKRLSSVTGTAAKAEGVRQELAAEVEEARRLWVAENTYNAMLQEELTRMQAILEIITHTAQNIMDVEDGVDLGTQEGEAEHAGSAFSLQGQRSVNPLSPNSPEAHHARILMMDLERVNAQQEAHMQEVDLLAGDLGLPSRSSSPKGPTRSPVPRNKSFKEVPMLHAGVFAPVLPSHMSVDQARGLLSAASGAPPHDQEHLPATDSMPDLDDEAEN